MTRPSRPSSCSGRRTSTDLGAEAAQHGGVLAHVALQREDADAERPVHGSIVVAMRTAAARVREAAAYNRGAATARGACRGCSRQETTDAAREARTSPSQAAREAPAAGDAPAAGGFGGPTSTTGAVARPKRPPARARRRRRAVDPAALPRQPRRRRDGGAGRRWTGSTRWSWRAPSPRHRAARRDDAGRRRLERGRRAGHRRADASPADQSSSPPARSADDASAATIGGVGYLLKPFDPVTSARSSSDAGRIERGEREDPPRDVRRAVA